MEIRNIRHGIIKNKFFPRALAEALLFSAVTGYLFYKSIIGGFFVFIVSAFLIPSRMKELRENEKDKRRMAFVDLLVMLKRLSASGMAINQCFMKAYEELRHLYYGEKVWIVEETKNIVNHLAIEPYAGPYLVEWGERDGIKEITDFGQVLEILQSSGGDVSAMVHQSASMISDRLETENQIKMISASKIFEQKVLFYLGYIMIVMLSSFMPSMFNLLYTSLVGRLVMTCSMSIMILGRTVGGRMTNIEV